MKKEKNAEIECQMDRGKAKVTVKASVKDGKPAVLVMGFNGQDHAAFNCSLSEFKSLISQGQEMIDFLEEDK